MKSLLKNRIKPDHIFLTALIIIPSFIFQDILLFKWVQVFLFITAAFASGKRIRLLPSLIMTAGIVAANLLTPTGEVVFQIADFPLTSGAFSNGLDKSALIIGMIYISKFAVSSGLRLPGGRKNILSLVFYYFEKIMEGEQGSSAKTEMNALCSDKNKTGRINRKSVSVKFSLDQLIKKIDRKIISVYNTSSDFEKHDKKSSSDAGNSSETSISGFVIICTAVVFNWALFSVKYF